MIYLLIFSLFTVFLFRKSSIVSTELKRIDVIGVWLGRILFSFIYLYIFTEYYGHGYLYGDSYRFFTDSHVIYQLAKEEPAEFFKLIFQPHKVNTTLVDPFLQNTHIWATGDNGDFINDNRFILILNVCIHFLSFGNVWVHSLVHSIISFLGVIFLYKAFKPHVLYPRLFWWFLGLMPSIAFWTDALLKESVMLFAMGLWFLSVIRLKSNFKFKWLVFFILSGVILLINKPYVGLIIIPFSILYWSLASLKYKQIILWAVTIFTFVFLLYAPQKINLTQKVSYKQKDMVNMGRGGIFFINDTAFCAFDYQYISHFKMTTDSTIQVLKNTSGEYKLFGQYDFYPYQQAASDQLYAHYLTQIPSSSFYQVPLIESSNKKLLMFTPKALFNVILRPFPWDNGNITKVFAFIQNLILIVLLIFAVIKARQLSSNDIFLLTVLCLIMFFISALIGWTTPIFGAAVRYKVPVDILMVITSFILFSKKTFSYEKN